LTHKLFIVSFVNVAARPVPQEALFGMTKSNPNKRYAMMLLR
jgi:hypothetical protein